MSGYISNYRSTILRNQSEARELGCKDDRDRLDEDELHGCFTCYRAHMYQARYYDSEAHCYRLKRVPNEAEIATELGYLTKREGIVNQRTEEQIKKSIMYWVKSISTHYCFCDAQDDDGDFINEFVEASKVVNCPYWDGIDAPEEW